MNWFCQYLFFVKEAAQDVCAGHPGNDYWGLRRGASSFQITEFHRLIYHRLRPTQDTLSIDEWMGTSRQSTNKLARFGFFRIQYSLGGCSHCWQALIAEFSENAGVLA
jgi:hypothetical protein